MSHASLPRPAELLPHRDDAVLLDLITLAEDHRLAASFVVRAGTAFSDASGNLPGWIGPEIMAEAISALSGLRSLNRRGHDAGIGLLLGVRGYTATAGEFHPGEQLDVEVIESSEDEEGRAVFDGKIRRDGRVVATGTLTVFQPADDSFLDRECARDD